MLQSMLHFLEKSPDCFHAPPQVQAQLHYARFDPLTHDGPAQALAVAGGAVIAAAGAGDDTGVRELDSTAEAAERG